MSLIVMNCISLINLCVLLSFEDEVFIFEEIYDISQTQQEIIGINTNNNHEQLLKRR